MLCAFALFAFLTTAAPCANLAAVRYNTTHPLQNMAVPLPELELVWAECLVFSLFAFKTAKCARSVNEPRLHGQAYASCEFIAIVTWLGSKREIVCPRSGKVRDVPTLELWNDGVLALFALFVMSV